MRSVMWFRRDLRLGDHPALRAAAEHGEVVGLFVVDPTLYDRAGGPRQRFLVDALAALDADMDGSLLIRHGASIDQVVDVARTAQADTVFASADYGPSGRERDVAIKDALAEHGIALRLIGSPYAVSPGSVLKKDGTPYAVFTPFSRAWREVGWKAPLDRPEVAWVERAALDHHGLPSAPTVDGLPAAGEQAARQQLDVFLADRVVTYADHRDAPALDHTSRLSAALKYGCIHPRTILDRLGTSAGEDVFRTELCWRDFYADVLHRMPHTAWQNLNRSMDAMRMDSGALADQRFRDWCAGRTGYPIVDAGMRQLLTEGFMHNRVRMIVASFLVKDLHLPWQRGARHFLTHLVDGDVASNNHGWQWAAGTGTDAAPYFRIFNPTSQGQKFDPDGTYVKRYVPELASVPAKFIHAPWTMTTPPAGYVRPIVDHGAERNEALARLAELKRPVTTS
jgi:deoxyribodipyrimidine photo-lyase